MTRSHVPRAGESEYESLAPGATVLCLSGHRAARARAGARASDCHESLACQACWQLRLRMLSLSDITASCEFFSLAWLARPVLSASTRRGPSTPWRTRSAWHALPAISHFTPWTMQWAW